MSSPACLFVNGLPLATFELKNSLTKQTVHDAIEQYQTDRDPRERLFEFGRCIVCELVADINRRLVVAGIDVYGLREVQASLEDWFLSVTSRLGEPS